MGFFRRIIMFLYFMVYFIVGSILFVFAMNVLSQEQLNDYMLYAYNDPNIKLAAGCLGALFILLGFFSAKYSLGRIRKEKTIAFENPDGQVVVSLSAIEDYIKRILKQVIHVKDVKTVVTAGKKGISVVCRATLFSDSNIPEITEKIQSVIKSKLNEMLGIEESINVKIHIAKLYSKGGTKEEEQQEDTNEQSRHMPFRGLE